MVRVAGKVGHHHTTERENGPHDMWLPFASAFHPVPWDGDDAVPARPKVAGFALVVGTALKRAGSCERHRGRRPGDLMSRYPAMRASRRLHGRSPSRLANCRMSGAPRARGDKLHDAADRFSRIVNNWGVMT